MIVPTFLIQKETSVITAKYTQKQFEAGDNMKGANSEQAKAFMKLITKFTPVLTILITVGWAGLKVIYYVFGIYYLKKREVVALYDGFSPQDDFDDSFG